jgi:tripartite-type tricarboxylate transporter receptor subunit TctC
VRTELGLIARAAVLALFSSAAVVAAQGRLRAIAVTSLERSEVMKDVPTLHESGYPGYEAINWFGAVSRTFVPKPVVDRMSAEFAKALDAPEVKGGLARLGLNNAYLDPEQYNAYMRAEMQSNEKIVQAAKIRME